MQRTGDHGLVLFHVQHLLGVGHLKRAAVIADALLDAGFDVVLALGGPEVPGVRFDGCARILLPSVRAADATFKVLLDENGRPIDDAWRERRADRLLTEFSTLRPDVVLLEMFPFGRLQFGFELLPLLEAARIRRPRPLILSSVRDALVHRDDPARNARIVGLVERWFDRVLVHGDPALFGLDATFPEAVRITDKLAYTGYVVKAGGPRQPAAAAGHGDVVVSVGGGAVGLPLIEAALAARPLCRLAGHVWRLIAGPNLPAEDYDRLAWEAPPGVVVERWRDDLPAILAGARLSISQAGYNTVMDVLAAGVPAIVVPFAAAAETEQTWRARAFAATGALTLLEARDLSPRRLAEAIDRSSDHGASSPAIDMTGAATSARLIRELQEARRSKNQLGQPPAQQ